MFIDFIHRCTEVFLDAGHGQLAVKTGQLVLELRQFLQQKGWNDVRPGGEGLSRFDEGGAEVYQQFGTLPGSSPGPGFILQLLEDPVEGHPQQQQADGHQGLPEPANQPLRVPCVNPRDGGRVVLEQTSCFDEIP